MPVDSEGRQHRISVRYTNPEPFNATLSSHDAQAGLRNLKATEYGHIWLLAAARSDASDDGADSESPGFDGCAGYLGYQTPAQGAAVGLRNARGIAPFGQALYVTDDCDGLIRHFDPSVAEMVTVAGQPALPGACGVFSCPNAPPLDGVGSAAAIQAVRYAIAAQGSIFLTDTNARQIRQVAPATQRVTTLVGVPSVSAYVDGVSAAAQ